MENTALNLNPAIGDRWVSVSHRSIGWEVHVQVFKKNSLRGDSYWVTEAFKTYRKEADARRFAARFN